MQFPKNICVFSFLGGLGNQMFEYAYLYSLSKSFPNHCYFLDFNKYAKLDPHNGFELFNVFPKSQNIFKEIEVPFHIKILKKLPIRIVKRFPMVNYILDDFVMYYNSRCSLKNGINMVFGVFSSPCYFDKNRNEIKNIFSFDTSCLSSSTQILAQEILGNESCSIHIRLGDYITNPGANKRLAGICDHDYYKQAVEYIQKKHNNVKFFVFSNEPKIALNYLPIDYDYFIVDVNTNHSSWQDMYLMSICNHNIIANSSFSWWGAYLNGNEDKIIVRPERFANEAICLDIFPEEWISVNDIHNKCNN